MSMRRILLTAFLATAIIISSAVASSPSSVQPLQTHAGNNFCSTFSINEAAHLYGTAAHCVADAAPEPYMFGQHVTVVDVAPSLDLAVVRAILGAPAIHISNRNMTEEGCRRDLSSCVVEVEGFPFGLQRPTYSPGHFIGEEFIDGNDNGVVGKNYSLFFVACAPGCSGGPIRNEEGQLQSVMQIEVGDTSIFGGATLSQVREFLLQYQQ